MQKKEGQDLRRIGKSVVYGVRLLGLAVIALSLNQVLINHNSSLLQEFRAAPVVLALLNDSLNEAELDGNFAPICAKPISSISNKEHEKTIAYITRLISKISPKVDAEKLAQAIVHESLKADYDPLFVTAVIKSESTFNEKARSNMGAIGLMQVMQATAEYMQRRGDSTEIATKIMLEDPRVNLRMGISYLKYLEEKFNGNRSLALAAYNWGPGNMYAALKNRKSIPTSTKKYVNKITLNHKQFQEQMGAENIKIIS